MTVDDLTEYGLHRMDDAAIEGFLSSHDVGVLGLPTDGAPTLRPLSYVYDDGALYLLYVVGSESRKADVSDRADHARFLVFSTEGTFVWRSVLLTGTVERVPEGADVELSSDGEPWRPQVIRAASDAEATALFRFDVEESSGVGHVGLPPGFDTAPDDA